MRETENNDKRDFHFYCQNCAEWQVSEDIDSLIKLMKRSCKQNGFKFFSMYYVPAPISAEYNIRQFKPEVEGCIFLGTYNTK